MSEADAGAGVGTPTSADRSSPVDPLAGAVFAALVLACFLAFFLTQHLKHTPTAVQNFELSPYFSPAPGGNVKEEAISFKLANADEATVEIINTGGDVVATLTRDRPVERYKQFSLRWDGRRGVAHAYGVASTPHGRPVLLPMIRGPLAAGGEYRVRVILRHHSRPVLSPRTFTLVRG